MLVTFNFYINDVPILKNELHKVQITNEEYINYIEKLKQRYSRNVNDAERKMRESVI